MGTFFHPTDQQWSIPASTTNYEVSVVDAVVDSDVELVSVVDAVVDSDVELVSVVDAVVDSDVETGYLINPHFFDLEIRFGF